MTVHSENSWDVTELSDWALLRHKRTSVELQQLQGRSHLNKGVSNTSISLEPSHVLLVVFNIWNESKLLVTVSPAHMQLMRLWWQEASSVLLLLLITSSSLSSTCSGSAPDYRRWFKSRCVSALFHSPAVTFVVWRFLTSWYESVNKEKCFWSWDFRDFVFLCVWV